MLTDLDSMWRLSNYISVSGLAPKGIEKPEAIVVAIQLGLEVGLTPMAALQNIAVINGRPTIWGDAQLAVVRGTGELESFVEYYEENGARLVRNPSTFSDTTTAVCRVKRKGQEVNESSFSVSDAKKAGLWGKTGPWSQYPARMLRFRARSFALRDNFGDALRGIRSTEEAIDIRDAEVISVETVAAPAGPVFNEKKSVKKPASAPEPTQETASTTPQAHAAQPEPTVPTQDPANGLSVSQQRLAEIVAEVGGSFGDLCSVAVSQAWIDQKTCEAWTGYADMPDAIAAKFVGAKRGVQMGIKTLLAAGQ